MQLRLRSGLQVGHKLGLAACAFAVPVIFVIWSLVSVQSIAVRFALPEIAGAHYLGALFEIQVQAAAAALSGDTAPPGMAGRSASLQSAAGTGLDCAAEAQAVIAALGIPAGLAAARARLRDLIVRIGDRSNLILDNVLGTYYLTDVVLNRLPDMLDNVADLSRTRHLAASDVDGRSQMLVGIGGLTADLDRTQGRARYRIPGHPP
jgi:methyl-accepting chemotaxis protein